MPHGFTKHAMIECQCETYRLLQAFRVTKHTMIECHCEKYRLLQAFRIALARQTSLRMMAMKRTLIPRQ